MFHDIRAELRAGEFLTAGFRSNPRSDVVMSHSYFTVLPGGAASAAELAVEDGAARVYVVEPTGAFEGDPDVRPGAVAMGRRQEACGGGGDGSPVVSGSPPGG